MSSPVMIKVTQWSPFNMNQSFEIGIYLSLKSINGIKQVKCIKNMRKYHQQQSTHKHSIGLYAFCRLQFSRSMTVIHIQLKCNMIILLQVYYNCITQHIFFTYFN
jgi:hypothetical protein